MTKIMELMEKRAKAWEAAKNFLDSHSDNGGNVSAEDAATYDRMEKRSPTSRTTSRGFSARRRSRR